MDACELIQETTERKLIYAFLARAYRTALDDAFLESLKSVENPDDTPLSTFYDELGNRDTEELRKELAAEYNRLFLNMGPHPVYPYESTYTSPEGLLMQDSRDQVVALYRADGLELSSDVHLPEDHISFEFEYMVHLCDRTIQSLEGGDEQAAQEFISKQKSFIADHLAVWIPEFSDLVSSRAQTSFYQGITSMTKTHLSLEVS